MPSAIELDTVSPKADPHCLPTNDVNHSPSKFLMNETIPSTLPPQEVICNGSVDEQKLSDETTNDAVQLPVSVFTNINGFWKQEVLEDSCKLDIPQNVGCDIFDSGSPLVTSESSSADSPIPKQQPFLDVSSEDESKQTTSQSQNGSDKQFKQTSSTLDHGVRSRLAL